MVTLARGVELLNADVQQLKTAAPQAGHVSKKAAATRAHASALPNEDERRKQDYAALRAACDSIQWDMLQVNIAGLIVLCHDFVPGTCIHHNGRRTLHS